jgi:four helix bundle protein
MGNYAVGQYDLEERTLNFAKRIVRMCKVLPNNTVNFKLVDQIIRFGGSIGANYREANDSLGEKDFIFRLKISRKEAKETEFWLYLIVEANPGLNGKMKGLIDEVIEIKKILSSIINKLQNK